MRFCELVSTAKGTADYIMYRSYDTPSVHPSRYHVPANMSSEMHHRNLWKYTQQITSTPLSPRCRCASADSSHWECVVLGRIHCSSDLYTYQQSTPSHCLIKSVLILVTEVCLAELSFHFYGAGISRLWPRQRWRCFDRPPAEHG